MKKAEMIMAHRDAIAEEMINRYQAVLEADGTIQYRIYIWDDGEIQSLEQIQGDRSWLQSRDASRQLYYVTTIDEPFFSPWDYAGHSAPEDEDEFNWELEQIINCYVDEFCNSLDDIIDDIIDDAKRQDEVC